MNLSKFRDLMASEELYFRRADLFDDKSEGIPPEEYALKVLRLNPYDVNDRATLNNTRGSIAQNREGYFICCWQLFKEETLDMWEQYGHNGVAIVSRYELLKEVLNGLFLDEAHIGLVRYGVDHLKGTFNALEFITTKQKKYEPECEVRTFIEVRDPLSGGNRHVDLNNVAHPQPLHINPRHAWVQDGKKRPINLRGLILDVVISPWADATIIEEIELWVKLKGFPASARQSGLKSEFTPTLKELRVRKAPIPAYVPDVPATEHEIQNLVDVLATADDTRLSFLYRQRWDTCELTDSLPRISDVKYLEATLRRIHERKNAAEEEKAKTAGYQREFHLH